MLHLLALRRRRGQQRALGLTARRHVAVLVSGGIGEDEREGGLTLCVLGQDVLGHDGLEALHEGGIVPGQGLQLRVHGLPRAVLQQRALLSPGILKYINFNVL